MSWPWKIEPGDLHIVAGVQRGARYLECLVQSVLIDRLARPEMEALLAPGSVVTTRANSPSTFRRISRRDSSCNGASFLAACCGWLDVGSKRRQNRHALVLRDTRLALLWWLQMQHAAHVWTQRQSSGHGKRGETQHQACLRLQWRIVLLIRLIRPQDVHASTRKGRQGSRRKQEREKTKGERTAARPPFACSYSRLLHLKCLLVPAELHLRDLRAVGNDRGVLRLLRQLDPLPLDGRDHFAILQNVEFLLAIVGRQLIRPGL